MKSKIKIDLDGENRPVMTITVSKDTEDLRDKILKRFLEELGYSSNALFCFPYHEDEKESTWDVFPYLKITDRTNEKIYGVSKSRLIGEAELFLAKAHDLNTSYQLENGDWYIMPTGGYVDIHGSYWVFNEYGFTPAHIKDNKMIPLSLSGPKNSSDGYCEMITFKVGDTDQSMPIMK